MEIDDVSGAVVDAAVKIHRDLGPRLFESVPPRPHRCASIAAPAGRTSALSA